MWRNSGEIPSNDLDDGGNGIVDILPSDQFLVHTGMPLHEVDNNFDSISGDYNWDGILDVFVINRSQTGINSTEVYVLNGANNFQNFLLHTGTALHEVDDTFEFMLGDFDRDDVCDLYAVKRSHTGVSVIDNCVQPTYLNLSGTYSFLVLGCDSFCTNLVKSAGNVRSRSSPFSVGWRDVQDILPYSARHTGTVSGAGISGDEEYVWDFNGVNNWNGSGLHLSNDYGFALVDVKAAVRLAETWNSTPQISTNDTHATCDLPNSIATISNAGDSFSGVVTSNIDIDIEFVEVDINFTRWDDLGDLELRLISPDGTSSILLNDIDITFSGNAIPNDDTFVFTEEYLNYAQGMRVDGASNPAEGFDIVIVDGFTGGDTITYTINGDCGTNDADTTLDDTPVILDVVGNDISPENDPFQIVGVSLSAPPSNGIVELHDDGSFLYTPAPDFTGTDTLIYTVAYDNGGIDTFNFTITVESGNEIPDELQGGDNYSVLNRGQGDDLLDIGNGADHLQRVSGKYVLDGRVENYTLLRDDADDILVSTEGSDRLDVAKGNDLMDGGYGVDTFHLVMRGGSNRLDYGDEGIATIYGGSSADIIDGGTEDDYIECGTEGDTTYGNDGAETFLGQNGSDIIYGQTGSIYGGDGGDQIYANAGDDYVEVGTYGDYTILGQWGNDRIRRQDGNDIIDGGTGEDGINGYAGADSIYGSEGNDLLIGHQGDDTIDGGQDIDTVYYQQSPSGVVGEYP